MPSRARWAASSRPAALFLATCAFTATSLAATAASACPFCGKGGAADSALSTVVVIGAAVFIIGRLRRRL